MSIVYHIIGLDWVWGVEIIQMYGDEMNVKVIIINIHIYSILPHTSTNDYALLD